MSRTSRDYFNSERYKENRKDKKQAAEKKEQLLRRYAEELKDTDSGKDGESQ